MDLTFDIELIGMIVGAVMTLMIFSYLFTDNFLYRWALALLVGSGVGYAMGLAIRFVLLDWAMMSLGKTSIYERVFYSIPLLLGVLLLLKGFAPTKFLGRIAVLGNISMGYLIGVGAAIAVSGALMGTIIPQVWATGQSLKFSSLLTGVLVVGGTISSLLVFSPRIRTRGGEPHPLWLWPQRVGRLFIVITLAVAYAAAITSALTTWTIRIWEIASWLMGVLW